MVTLLKKVGFRRLDMLPWALQNKRDDNWSGKWKEKPKNALLVMVTSAYRSTREFLW